MPIIGQISVGDGATFTPSITNDVLSWTNDKNLPNPPSLDIVGATFTPSINNDVLSWSNNKGLPNPESLDIVGATFTPAVSNAGVLSWSNNKGLPNPPTVDMAQAVVDKKPGWGIPLGYEYFTFNPNIPQGALPLFGGEYSRTTYSDLWAWVQTQTGYLKTEAEWQDLSTANNGNVPYYSDGDGSTTFRVPSLKCWVKAADGTVTEVGSYKAAGLPNITGYMWHMPSNSAAGLTNSGGVMYQATGSGSSWRVTTTSSGELKNAEVTQFDASRSSSIYGNSTTVQPESVVGLWLVQAYGVVVDTGTINEQQYIDDRMATRLPLAGGTMMGNIAWTKGEVGYRSTTHTAPYDPCRQMIVTAGTVDSEWDDGNAKLALHAYDSTGTNTAENGAFVLQASDGNGNAPFLEGKPNGDLKWNGNGVITSAITGNVLNASGSFTTLTTVTDACSITTHPAGVWLVLTWAHLGGAGDGIYVSYISSGTFSRYVRGNSNSGGGIINMVILSLAENQVVTMKGYLANSGQGRFNGELQMVRLA